MLPFWFEADLEVNATTGMVESFSCPRGRMSTRGPSSNDPRHWIVQQTNDRWLARVKGAEDTLFISFPRRLYANAKNLFGSPSVVEKLLL
jgi:hypothetical protein